MQLEDQVIIIRPSHAMYGKVGVIDGFGAVSDTVWVRVEGSKGTFLIASEDLEVVVDA